MSQAFDAIVIGAGHNGPTYLCGSRSHLGGVPKSPGRNAVHVILAELKGG